MAQASDRDKEIHRQMLARDDLAFAQLCDELYETVYKKVKQYATDLPPGEDTLVADAVTDAFLNYFNRPERYQPEKQSLAYFLIMDAGGDLKNAQQKTRREEKKFPKSVELFEKDGNSLMEEGILNPYDTLIGKEAEALLRKKLEEIFAEETDRALAQLMLAGERRSSEYAQVLNILHLPAEAQKTEVKKNKDRIDKIIRRKLRTGKTDG